MPTSTRVHRSPPAHGPSFYTSPTHSCVCTFLHTRAACVVYVSVHAPSCVACVWCMCLCMHPPACAWDLGRCSPTILRELTSVADAHPHADVFLVKEGRRAFDDVNYVHGGVLMFRATPLAHAFLRTWLRRARVPPPKQSTSLCLTRVQPPHTRASKKL